MIVNSTRFGPVETPEDKIIKMAKPILGFEEFKRFVLIEIDEIRPFMWLQAVDEPAVAFLVVNPVLVYPGYRIEVNAMEIGEIKINDAKNVETYVIVTVPEDPREISVNLQGPILINTENNLAKQLVLVNSEYKIKFSLMDEMPIGEPATAAPTRENEMAGV